MFFLNVFISLFVSIDPLGALPVFLSLLGDTSYEKKKKIIRESVITGFIIATIFLFGGKLFLLSLGIKSADLFIAGGSILFILGAHDLLLTQKKEDSTSSIKDGVVPLGVPLIVGPAVLTTLVLLKEKFGTALTFIALVVNLSLTYLFLINSEFIVKILGKRGIKVLSKIMNLILCALGIRLVREGLISILINS